jgi:hypothetical protein
MLIPLVMGLLAAVGILLVFIGLAGAKSADPV